MGTARGARSRISLFTARLLWAEASLGGRLGAAFLPISMRVRRSWCCSRPHPAAAPASSPTSYYKQKKVYKDSSAMPHLQVKNYSVRHAAPLLNNT